MAKQIKIFDGNWTCDVSQEVNEFIKDKKVLEIRYKFEERATCSRTYHNVFIIYEVDDDKVD